MQHHNRTCYIYICKYLYNLLELFNLDCVPKQLGSGTTIGRTGSRQEITKRDDTIQIIKFLARYRSPTNTNNGANTR